MTSAVRGALIQRAQVAALPIATSATGIITTPTVDGETRRAFSQPLCDAVEQRVDDDHHARLTGDRAVEAARARNEAQVEEWLRAGELPHDERRAEDERERRDERPRQGDARQEHQRRQREREQDDTRDVDPRDDPAPAADGTAPIVGHPPHHHEQCGDAERDVHQLGRAPAESTTSAPLRAGPTAVLIWTAIVMRLIAPVGIG